MNFEQLHVASCTIGMASLITYTVLTLGECKLHQLHTDNGKVLAKLLLRTYTLQHIQILRGYLQSTHVSYLTRDVVLQFFVMGEVAVQLFEETPASFLQVGSRRPCQVPQMPVLNCFC